MIQVTGEVGVMELQQLPNHSTKIIHAGMCMQWWRTIPLIGEVGALRSRQMENKLKLILGLIRVLEWNQVQVIITGRSPALLRTMVHGATCQHQHQKMRGTNRKE